MPDRGMMISLHPARVIGWLRPDSIDVEIHPDYRDFQDMDGNPAAATQPLLVELFSADLRRPNTDIWLVVEYREDRSVASQKILPRKGHEYPEEYASLKPPR